MKPLILASAALVAMVLPSLAAAQAKPANNAADIVCQMTGDCGGAAGPGQQRDLPHEAAFSFTKSKAAATPSAPAVTAAPTRTVSVAAARPVRRPVAGVPARAPSGGMDMQITFGLGSADMTATGKTNAAEFAKAMAVPAMADRRFTVEGHTDARGDRDANMKLSQARADSVVTYLRSLGVDGSRLEAKGYGPDKPLPGRSASAPANRRVAFVPAS